MNSKITTLNNGLRILTYERPETETVSLGLWVNTGSAYEDRSVNGISHFLEHMAFKGTKTRSALQISEEIEDVGGQSNAYTSREFTAFYAKMLKGDAELAMDILTDTIKILFSLRKNLLKNVKWLFKKSNNLLILPMTLFLIIFKSKLFLIRLSDGLF